jgi:hypothetical protein
MTSTAGGRISRCYRIHWRDPLSTPVDRIDAESPFHALDIYAKKHGYGGYFASAEEQPFLEVFDVDEYGLNVVYENGTLWAIQDVPGRRSAEEWTTSMQEAQRRHAVQRAERLAREAEEREKVKRNEDLERIIFEGMWVSVLRNGHGQLTVVVNTEGVSDRDQDADGDPYVQVLLNDAQLHDYERPADTRDWIAAVSDDDMWLIREALILMNREVGSETHARISELAEALGITA